MPVNMSRKTGVRMANSMAAAPPVWATHHRIRRSMLASRLRQLWALILACHCCAGREPNDAQKTGGACVEGRRRGGLAAYKTTRLRLGRARIRAIDVTGRNYLFA